MPHLTWKLILRKEWPCRHVARGNEDENYRRGDDKKDES